MNREIKFRAWNIIDKKMVRYWDWDYRQWCVRTDGIFWYISKEWFLDYESYNCIIMQYTWLKDKNWKEIYEGDIVKWRVRSMSPNETTKQQLFIVEWDEMKAGFFLTYIHQYPRGTTSYRWDFINSPTKEVIWNIYENPDILPPTKIN